VLEHAEGAWRRSGRSRKAASKLSATTSPEHARWLTPPWWRFSTGWRASVRSLGANSAGPFSTPRWSRATSHAA